MITFWSLIVRIVFVPGFWVLMSKAFLLAVLYSGRSSCGQSMDIFRFLYSVRFFRFFMNIFLSKLVKKAIFTGSNISVWGAVGGGFLDLIRKISHTVVLD